MYHLFSSSSYLAIHLSIYPTQSWVLASTSYNTPLLPAQSIPGGIVWEKAFDEDSRFDEQTKPRAIAKDNEQKIGPPSFNGRYIVDRRVWNTWDMMPSRCSFHHGNDNIVLFWEHNAMFVVSRLRIPDFHRNQVNGRKVVLPTH